MVNVALNVPELSEFAVAVLELLSNFRVMVSFALNPDPFTTTRSPGLMELGVTLIVSGLPTTFLRDAVAFEIALPITPPAAVVALAIASPADAAACPADAVAFCADVVALCTASEEFVFADAFELSFDV